MRHLHNTNTSLDSQIEFFYLTWSYAIVTCFTNVMDLEGVYRVLLPIPTELPEQVTGMTGNSGISARCQAGSWQTSVVSRM